MPAEKKNAHVVLEVGKHDSFNVYVGTEQKLGGKVKVAKFAVVDVTHVRINEPKQLASGQVETK
jgi:hypothetical protein